MVKTILVVAAIIVRPDGKILCAQRGNDKNPNVAWKWEFPGGKIEKNETAQKALIRELHEEMDFSITICEKITTVHHKDEFGEIVMEAFLCVPTDINAHFVLREHANAIWLSPQDIINLDWADADKPIVEQLLTRSFI